MFSKPASRGLCRPPRFRSKTSRTKNTKERGAKQKDARRLRRSGDKAIVASSLEIVLDGFGAQGWRVGRHAAIVSVERGQVAGARRTEILGTDRENHVGV